MYMYNGINTIERSNKIALHDVLLSNHKINLKLDLKLFEQLIIPFISVN